MVELPRDVRERMIDVFERFIDSPELPIHHNVATATLLKDSWLAGVGATRSACVADVAQKLKPTRRDHA